MVLPFRQPSPFAAKAAGLALGSLNGALNLDVALSYSNRAARPHPLDAARIDAHNV